MPADDANVTAHTPCFGDEVRGVRWSGMQEHLPQPTLADLQAAQAERVRRAAEFAKSARGRFLAALHGVRQLPTWEAAGWKAQDAYSRGFADTSQAPSLGELGIAALALADVPGNDARTAREALAEIMIEAHREAA